MNERIKAASELLSSYNTVVKQKQIIDEQMFSTFELYRGLEREERSLDCQNGLYSPCKKELEDRLVELHNKHAGLFLKQRFINSLLDRIPLTEKTVLRRFFITGGAHGVAEELMELLSFEKTHIYRLKDRGLMRIAEMMEIMPDFYSLTKGTDQDA